MLLRYFVISLEIADPESLIRFLPPILVYQMKLLATRYDLLRSAAFHGVIAIVHRCVRQQHA